MNSRLMIGALLLLISIATDQFVFCQSLNSRSDSSGKKPNIVLVNLDDADSDQFSAEALPLYPNIKGLASSGIQLTNLHVTTPFCGPSRASLFRGQYAHRCGVRVNVPESPVSLGFNGGYSEFLRAGHDQNELGVWMKKAGYHTMMIGKYHHNGFDFRKPPGWDDFYMSNGGRYLQTFRFTTRDDPAGKKMAPESDIYRTDQEGNDAIDLIRRHSTGDQPFFLYVAPLAPHRPVGPDFTEMVDKKKYEDWMPDLLMPLTPDFDESDLSDKPAQRRSPPLSSAEIEMLQAEFLCRARAVKSVDDMVGRIVSKLTEVNQLDNTYIFFTSDNGYQLGHHRQHNKLDPYERCTHVPLYVVGPGIAAGQSANHLLAHFDIAATILELAGGKLPDFCDAKSFAPLLFESEKHNPRNWREFVVIENWQAKQNLGNVVIGTYSGLRFYDQTYVEWASGEKSFYNLANDPFQIENSYPQLADEKKAELKLKLLNSRAVNMNPLVTIVDPTADTGMSTSFAVQGVAEDDRLVQRVILTLQDSHTRKFWSGDKWTDESNSLIASQSSADQQIIFWDYPLERLAKTLETPTEIQVTAWAVDGEGNGSESPYQRGLQISPRQ